MEKNVCGIDRLVRAILGVLLVGGVLASGRQDADERSIGGLELLAVYAIAELSVNVFAQWCPLNALFGFDSCRSR